MDRERERERERDVQSLLESITGFETPGELIIIDSRLGIAK